MDGIVASRPGTRGCAALPVEQGSHPQPHSARNRKRGHKGPFFNFWRRGQSARIARTCGPGDRGLTFSAMTGLSLRDRACGCAAAPVEQGSHPQPHSARNRKRGHKGPIFNFWRRGWDSNPRKATNLCWFSRPVHSTALPPLQIVVSHRVGWIRRLRRLTPSGRTSCVLTRCASQSNPRKATNLCWFSRPVH